MLLIRVLIILLCAGLVNTVSGLTITEGPEIQYDNDNVYINTNDVLIYSTYEVIGSGYTYIDFSAKQYTGNIDLAIGFNTENVQPKKVEFYDGLNWIDISYKFFEVPYVVHNNYDNKNKWYAIKNQGVVAGTIYKIRIYANAHIELNKEGYKYDIIIKPSEQSFLNAQLAGKLYVLDPYWNTSWSNRKLITVTTNGTSTPTFYQVRLNISYESEMQADFDDLRFTNLSNGSIPYWIEYKVDSNYALVWVNLSDAITDPGSDTIWMYYGNDAVSDGSDGDATFPFFDDFDRSDGVDLGPKWGEYGSGLFVIESNTLRYPNSAGADDFDLVLAKIDGNLFSTDDLIIDTKIRIDSLHASGYVLIAARSNSIITSSHRSYSLMAYTTVTAFDLAETQIAFLDTSISTQALTEWWNWRFLLEGTNFKGKLWQVGDTAGDTWDVEASDNTIASGYVGVGLDVLADRTADFYIDDFRVRKYITNEPTVVVGTVQYYTDSLHYNSTDNYNNSIDVNGAIISNRTVQTIDDTNWTANSTGQTHWIFANEVSISGTTYFSISGDDLDNFTVYSMNVSTAYNLINSSGVLENQSTDDNGTVTYESNLTVGNYWLSNIEVQYNVSRVSQTPEFIFENSTGSYQVIWDVVHDPVGLNHSAIYYMWDQYDFLTGCYNNSIRYPANNKADIYQPTGESILKHYNRNSTALFENITELTEGNIWKWGGLDKNSARMNISEISDTNTIIYINGSILDKVFPVSWPLDRSKLQDATKTARSIHVGQPLLIKWYDIEAAKGNTDYVVSAYFDTELNGLTPTFPVDIFYANNSFDPAGVIDIEDSEYLVYIGSVLGDEWINWTYLPRPNASYVTAGFLNYSTVLAAGITPTKDAYWYFKTQASSQRAYDIMVTNEDSGTNISFADSGLLWVGDTAPYISYPYTASSFQAFSRGEVQLNYRLFVQDNNSVNATSLNYTVNISASIFPPSIPSINHFHFLDENDTAMNLTYYGNFTIGVGVSNDPDGGVVTHNLTLHYENRTIAGIINNTFTDENVSHNGLYTDINFNSTQYYSDDWNYTLRVIATDDEGFNKTVWLPVNFTLSNTPAFTSYTPISPATSIYGNNQTFTIYLNQFVNVTWLIDGVPVKTATNVNISSYSNNTAAVNTYNLTSIISNVNGTNQNVWSWSVEDNLYAAILELQDDVNEMKRTQTIIQALILLVIGVVVGVVAQRRQYDKYDKDKYK